MQIPSCTCCLQDSFNETRSTQNCVGLPQRTFTAFFHEKNVPNNRQLNLRNKKTTTANKQTKTATRVFHDALNLSEPHLPFQHRCRPTSFQVARGLSRSTWKNYSCTDRVSYRQPTNGPRPRSGQARAGCRDCQLEECSLSLSLRTEREPTRQRERHRVCPRRSVCTFKTLSCMPSKRPCHIRTLYTCSWSACLTTQTRTCSSGNTRLPTEAFNSSDTCPSIFAMVAGSGAFALSTAFLPCCLG